MKNKIAKVEYDNISDLKAIKKALKKVNSYNIIYVPKEDYIDLLNIPNKPVKRWWEFWK
jgi:hypothetical protein